MGLVSRVVKFAEGIFEAQKRTAPRGDWDNPRSDCSRPESRQIMAERFVHDVHVDVSERELGAQAFDDAVREMKSEIAEDEKQKLDFYDKVSAEPEGYLKGRYSPTFHRLLKTNATQEGLYDDLIQDVRNGDLKVTDAAQRMGVEKKRTRVGNMKAEWIRATHEERIEFLHEVMDKQLFDRPAHSGWLLRNPGYSTVPDGARGLPTERKD